MSGRIDDDSIYQDHLISNADRLLSFALYHIYLAYCRLWITPTPILLFPYLAYCRLWIQPTPILLFPSTSTIPRLNRNHLHHRLPPRSRPLHDNHPDIFHPVDYVPRPDPQDVRHGRRPDHLPLLRDDRRSDPRRAHRPHPRCSLEQLGLRRLCPLVGRSRLSPSRWKRGLLDFDQG